jgi:hypothetical protein
MWTLLERKLGNDSKTVACCLALFAVSAASQLRCQEPAPRRVRIGVQAGTWSIGEGHWPFVLVGGEYQVSPELSLGLELGGVSRPVTLCSKGLVDPMCDERKLIRMVTGKVRYELGSGTVRPYVGASLGPTWYYHDGTTAGLHAGVDIPFQYRVSFRLDGALHVISESGEGGGATSLQLGAYYHL